MEPRTLSRGRLREELLARIPARCRNSNAFHIGLRGIDTRMYSWFGSARPIEETIICCDYGQDHVQMLRNGTKRIVSLEHERGFHADWSTDDLDSIPRLPSFRRLLDEARRSDGSNPTLFIPFKNTHAIDELRSREISLLASPYELVHKFDSKMNLPGILRAAGIEQIPGEIVQRHEFNEMRFRELVQRYGNRLVVQLEFGSGGSGTYFVESMDEVNAVFMKHDARQVKVSRFINGPSLNGHAVVLETTEGNRTMVFNPSFQIIGLPELTDWASYYCGNDFTGVTGRLGPEGMEQYSGIMQMLGGHMASEGWKGVFGVDLIYSTEEKKVYVLEINPRMNASTSFLHYLLERRGEPGIGIYHLLAFLAEMPVPVELTRNMMADLTGSHVLVNNKTGRDVTVAGDLPAGTYRLNGGFYRNLPGYWAAELGQGDYLVTCGVPRPETKVENHATLLKIYAAERAMNDNGNGLAPAMGDVVRNVYRRLAIQ